MIKRLLQVMILLWQFESCPFCAQVRQLLTALHLDFVALDASSQAGKAFVEKLGGKPQVPFLIDTKKHFMLYESNAIIKFLQQGYGI